MPKTPFDIDLAMQRIKKVVQPFAKAALFELFDEVMLPTTRRLFARARTPQALSQLSPDEIKALIRSITLPEISP